MPARTGGRLRATLVLVVIAVVALAVVAPSPPVGADLPPAEVSPDEARDRADDVLSQRQFQRPEPNVFDRATGWISERLGRLLGDLVSGGAGSVVGWAVILVALAALLYFLTRLGRSVQRDPGARTSISVERARTADEWRADAEDHERAGEWKAALRSRFRALIADLVALEQVDDVPGRTAGEYRAEVAESVPGAAHAFAEATRLFEAAWYGDRPTGREENHRFRALADEVVAEAERPGDRVPVAVGASA